MRPVKRTQKVPEFLNETPWYSNTNSGEKDEKKSETKWYQRGVKGEAATSYRKGACTNCGAMTHKTKDCMERPRKRGAKLTGKDIKPDEIITEVGNLTYEEKRDNWNGYEVENYEEYYKNFQDEDLEARKKKQDELAKRWITEPDPEQRRFPSGHVVGKQFSSEVSSGVVSESSTNVNSESDNSETKDEGKSSTSKGLRNRYDTAKYLLNLDPDSAEYDPKTRSMRGNPLPDDPTSNFQGDGKASIEGYYDEFKTIQKFAWESNEGGKNVILEASPSQAELLHREFIEKKKKMEIEKQNKLKEKYGLEETKELPKDLLLGQTEQYFEYSNQGDVIGGKKIIMPKSSWEEDVYHNDHTSVWGSYFHQGEWGYQCCQKLEYESFCTLKRKNEDVELQNKKQKIE
jgi:pre-mRNA-processing factor SLU7